VVTCILANTEYLLVLPDCVRFEFHCRDSSHNIRFAFETGHVAAPADPYFTLHGAQEYYSYPVAWVRPNLPNPLNIYFASANAGEAVEIITWR
jgi:hypothetical protein